MTAPLIAIVGRPNVGKSTLFNRLVGGRPALVHDTPGLTRDRRYGDVDYFGSPLRVIDTGGLDPDAARPASERPAAPSGPPGEAASDGGPRGGRPASAAGGERARSAIGAGIHRQALRAIDEADALLLVVDGRAGLSSVDHDLARQLRATGKPLFLAVNKIDHPTRDDLVHEFYQLGLGQPYPVSAAHGRGVDALLEAIVDATRPAPPPEAGGEQPAAELTTDERDEIEPYDEEAEPQAAREPLRVAFVGRPNAGKSALTNRLLGEERSLVHHEAGTTTDPVDTPFTMRDREYVLVDTAGIRRKARIDEDIEKIAVTMAIGQIDRADIVVLVIDAQLGPAEQDARIAGMVEEAGRALVIALNKSDLVTSDAEKATLREQTTDTFHFLSWAPTVLLSAQRGDGVDRLLDTVDRVARQHARRIKTSELNRFFADVIETKPPPLHHGRSVRIHYVSQVATRPPTFVLWANTPEGLAPSYKRFIANQLRDRYGFAGTPLRIAVKAKHDRHQRDA